MRSNGTAPERHALTVIARIHSDFSEKFGIPRQSGLVEGLRARIVFEPEFRDPEAVRAAVEAEARRIEAEGVDPGLWDRVKKGVYGWRVRSLNSFETLCVNQAQNFFAGREYLRFADLFADIRKEDVEALIARWVTPARTSLSVIRPKEVG